MLATCSKYIGFGKRLFYNKCNTPLYLIFFVTSKCNMKCKHCFYWKELNTVKNELTLDEIEKFGKTLDPLLLLRLTGGEPFLRNDLVEIVKIFSTKAKNIGISTNGYFTERTVSSIAEIIKFYENLEVCISVDDIPEQHDRNRQSKGSFDSAIKTLRELKKIKKVRTAVGLTISAENQNRLNSVFDLLKQEQPDVISVNLVRGCPKNAELKNVNIENYLKFFDIIEQYNTPKHKLYLNINMKNRWLSNLIAKTVTENKWQGVYCNASDKAGVLYPNGDLAPCELLDRKIGNLRDYDYDFRKIWLSSTNKSLQDYVKAEKCFCAHECFITCNILLEPKNLMKFLLLSSISQKKRGH